MTARAWAVTVTLGVALVAATFAWDATLGRLGLALVKLGSLAFGGGFTLIPLMQREVVERWGWLTTREFIDGIALGQVTPGPIVITATFVGYRVAGVAGAIVATAAVLVPSFLVLVAAIPHYDRIKRLRLVQVMVQGVLAAFVALLISVLLQFGQAALIDWKTWSLAAVAAIALWRKVDLLVIVAGGAALSVVMF